MSLRGRVLAHLRNRLGGLPLRLVFRYGDAFEFAPAPRVTLTTAQLATGSLVFTLKPLPGGPAPRPWTRAYRYAPEAEAPLTVPIDWSRFE